MSRVYPERIIKRRKELGLSQVMLAERVGISQQAVNQLEKGETQRPRRLREIAQALNVSEDWLLGGDVTPDPPQGVGLISWVQAGSLSEVIDSYELGDAEMWIDYPSRHGDMIALRVRGSSMNKVSPEGSIIIINLRERELIPNRLYVVKVGNEATYKRYKANPPRLVPESTDAHEDIFLTGKDIQPVGRVVRTMIDFE